MLDWSLSEFSRLLLSTHGISHVVGLAAFAVAEMPSSPFIVCVMVLMGIMVHLLRGSHEQNSQF
jgi:hypothetical protein